MIVAILLFDKYGLKKTRIEKQTEILIQFLSVMKKLSFWMYSDTHSLQYKPDLNLESVYELVYEKKLFFDDTYIKAASSISEYGYNINMPKSVANKIKVLKPYSMISIDKNKVPNDDFIVTMHSLGDKKLIEKVFSRINNQELTLFDYHNIWIDINDEAKKWFKDNHIDIDDLNIN